jgi:hypothetical protein
VGGVMIRFALATPAGVRQTFPIAPKWPLADKHAALCGDGDASITAVSARQWPCDGHRQRDLDA